MGCREKVALHDRQGPPVYILDFLMKTRHPGYCLPLAPTVARDVKHVFVEMHQQVSKMLKVTQHTYLLIHLTNFTHRELTVH